MDNRSELSLSDILKGTAIAAACILGVSVFALFGAYCANQEQKRKTIKVSDTGGTLTFQTPNGSIQYEIASEARQEWQKLLFYEEARRGGALYAADLFELCKKTNARRNGGEQILDLEEITKARREAERNY